MKLHHLAAATVLAGLCPLAVQAQTLSPTRLYGSLGYAETRTDHNADYGLVVGRLGARFGKFAGVEGELGVGVRSDDYTYAGATLDDHLKRRLAGYVVGYAPLKPNLDLFARVGFGQTKSELDDSGQYAGAFKQKANSWNYGLGAQYFLNPSNGVRLDYTHHDFEHDRSANVWSVSYVRRF